MQDKNLQSLQDLILERLMIDLQAEKELPRWRGLVVKKPRGRDMDLRDIFLDLDRLILLYDHDLDKFQG